jgi:RNA polymerase sigma-70 factor (ECF subfamily)
MVKEDDKHIIKQVRKGDVAAYSMLIEKYRHMVFTLALQLTKNEADAEEVAQDAFLKAFRALDSFEGRSAFSTWIYRITYHQAISKMRGNKRKQTDYDEDTFSNDDNLAVGNLSSEILESEDRTRYLKEALARLKGEESTVLTLYYFEEFKVDEISEITGLSESNVKVKLLRGRRNLLRELKAILKSEAGSLL